MALEGTLHDIPLVDLLEIFAIGSKTGLLALSSGSERGQITVCNGVPIDAALIGESQQLLAADDEAMIHLLIWDDGEFVFHSDPTAEIRPVRIVASSADLIRESEQRREKASQPDLHIGTRLGLAALPADPTRLRDLDLDEWRLVAALAQGSTLGEACLEAGLIPSRALDLAGDLLQRGLISVALPGTQISANLHAYAQPEQQQAPPIARSATRWTPAGSTAQSPLMTPPPPPAPSGVANSSLLKAIIRRVRAI